jgi:4-oxalocrotonate tautomerase
LPVVILKTGRGRKVEQKKVLIREFTKTIHRYTGVEPDMVTVLIDELDRDNTGKSGRMLSEGT